MNWSLNPDKTQELWINSGKTEPGVSIGSSQVPPMYTINILGLKFEHGLQADSHIWALTTSVASLAGIARCLGVPIPPLGGWGSQ